MTRGQARTRLARRAVVDAARALFLERGYGATTIDVISETADVPPATVYRLFRSKHGILKAVIDVSIVGDDDDVAMADRPEVRSLLAVTEPAARIEAFVRVAVQVNERVGPLYRILLSAAGTDPEAAALLDQLTRQRQQGQRLLAASLADDRWLRGQLGEREAADIVHALVSPEMYRLLVIDRGWPTDQFERWLARALVVQLLEVGADEAPEPQPGG